MREKNAIQDQARSDQSGVQSSDQRAGVGAGPSHVAGWPVSLRCPFDVGVAVSLYATWADVPDWWPCTCGAEHAKESKPCTT